MRLSGLASGMDTDGMIKEMMKTERLKVDKLNQSKQVLLWRQETFNSLNKNLVNFILDSKKKLGVETNYSGGISYKNINWSKSATVNKESKSTATASPNAIDGKHTIEVERMAEGVTGVSNGPITTGVDGKKDSISNQFNNLGENDIMEFTIAGKNGEAGVKFVIGNDATGTNKAVEGEINTVRITKKLSEVNLSEIVSKINNATVTELNADKTVKSISPLGMKASYDEKLDRFFIQTRNTGKDASMQFTAADTPAGNKGADFINGLKLNVTSFDENGVKTGPSLENVAVGATGTSYKGVSAKVNYSIDGVSVAKDLEYSTNSFNINGINFTAKAAGEITEVTIGTNVDEVYDKVKEFIDGYNKIIDEMSGLVSEKTYRNFKPLTAEEKGAMSEEEVKLWEVKARSGSLKGDETLTRTLQSLRSGTYDVVEGASGSFNHITQIGITTEKYASGSSGGRLQINEDALRKAISDDANGVLDLLFKSPAGELDTDDANLSADQLKSKRASSGIMTRMYHNLAEGMKGIVEKSGVGEEVDLLRKVRARITQDFVTKHSSRSLLDKNIFDYDKSIDKMNMYLSNREQFYYNKFSAMEQAMQKASSQSGWLMQQFGGGQ